MTLVDWRLLRARPHHSGLFFCAKTQFLVKSRSSCAEPEKFHLFESGMTQNALDYFCSDPLCLIGLIDNHVPDRCPIDEIRQDTTDSDQMIAIPGTERQIRVTQHFPRLFEGTIFRPWSLME